MQQTLRLCTFSWFFFHLYQLCNYGLHSSNPENTNHTHGVLWPMVVNFEFKRCGSQLCSLHCSSSFHAAHRQQNIFPHFLQWWGSLGLINWLGLTYNRGKNWWWPWPSCSSCSGARVFDLIVNNKLEFNDAGVVRSLLCWPSMPQSALRSHHAAYHLGRHYACNIES